MPIALIRLSLGGMLVKKYLIPTLNSRVKFHVTKLLDEQFLPLVAMGEKVCTLQYCADVTYKFFFCARKK